MSDKELQILTESLIEKYFDGTSTLEEERMLRLLLADSRVSGDSVEEARAVMGYLTMDNRQPHGKLHHRKRRAAVRAKWITATAIAASVAIAFIVGIKLTWKPENQQLMTAYVGGNKITDTNAIMNIVESDLAVFASAEAETELSIEADLSTFNEMIN